MHTNTFGAWGGERETEIHRLSKQPPRDQLSSHRKGSPGFALVSLFFKKFGGIVY